jgi:hypothetical protein
MFFCAFARDRRRGSARLRRRVGRETFNRHGHGEIGRRRPRHGDRDHHRRRERTCPAEEEAVRLGHKRSGSGPARGGVPREALEGVRDRLVRVGAHEGRRRD